MILLHKLKVTIEDAFDKVEPSLRCSRFICMNIYIYIHT